MTFSDPFLPSPSSSSSSSTMPTPLKPSIDNKENDPSLSTSSLCTPRRPKIVWSEQKEVFSYSPGLAQRFKNSRSSSHGPNKSILKPSRPLSPFPREKARDITPFPESPLDNAHYLVYPIDMILSEETNLRELTEAYSILAARIRQSLPPDFFDDTTREAQYKLFKPLKDNAERLSRAVERDLGRVFADPFKLPSASAEPLVGKSAAGLPTPLPTPSPKKGGMSEEQVKYARDLSTVASATVKCLTLLFQSPSIYNAFTILQIKRMLTAALSIPLAESLRSPTARKICGFAITLLQAQRLPDEILKGSAERIALALKRGIVGELGREGKKGATAEALRAIHDLSLFKSHIFIPAFSVYIPAVLDVLTGPSCALRVLAAHAIGGFALAVTEAEFIVDPYLVEISPVIQNALLQKEPSEKSATTLPRALALAMRTLDPTHPGQGPYWAASVLASSIILAGPTLLKDFSLLSIIKRLLDLGLQQPKKSIKNANQAIWGPLLWSWIKWRRSPYLSDDEESEDDEEKDKAKVLFAEILHSSVQMSVGRSFVGALLGPRQSVCSTQDVIQALVQIVEMAHNSGPSAQQALNLLERLVNASEPPEYYENWESTFIPKLIPTQLFSVSPGVLVADNAPQMINFMINSMPSIDDVRPLSKRERALPVVWMRVRDAWLECVFQLYLDADDPTVPDEFIEIWTGFIKMVFSGESQRATSELRSKLCASILVGILSNCSLDFRRVAGEAQAEGVLPRGGPQSAENQHIKLAIVRQFWTSTVELLPRACAAFAAVPLADILLRGHDEFVPSDDDDSVEETERALGEWAAFCAQVDAVSAGETTLSHWNKWEWDESSRARAWRAYARGWVENKKGSWQGATEILGLPFRDPRPWDMSEADLSEWSSLLSYVVEESGKNNISSSDALNYVVGRINRKHLHDLHSTLRVADHLVCSFNKDIEGCEAVPSMFLDFLKNVLEVSYPPKRTNIVYGAWLMRSIQSAFNKCPTELVLELLEAIQDGLTLWLADECDTFTAEYSDDFVPVFQTILCALEELSPTTTIIKNLAPLVESVLDVGSLGDGSVPSERQEALVSFRDFWIANCEKLTPPAEGWPECLTRPFASSSREPTAPTGVSYDLPPSSPGPESEEDELDVLPRTCTPRMRTANLVPLPPSPSPVRIHFDISVPVANKPVKKSKVGAMRPRLPALFDMSPSSSPTARKGTHRRTSSQKQHRRSSSGMKGIMFSEEDKENAAPLAKSDSDDIVIHSKRPLLDADSTPVRAKRQRTESSESVNSDDSAADAHAVEHIVVLEDSPRKNVSPFGKHNSNAPSTTVPFNTPTKRTLPSSSRAQTRTPFSSPTKRRKTQTPLLTDRLPKSSRQAKPTPSNEGDDDYLPPSSDLESGSDSSDEDDEQDQITSSSSPIGPLTPKQIRRAEFMAAAMAKDPASDDHDDGIGSSPIRKVRVRKVGLFGGATHGKASGVDATVKPVPLSPVL